VPEPLEVVTLAVPVGKWPAGTVAMLVESYEDGGIVEVADEESEGIDLVAVPYGALLRRDRSIVRTA
jgi:hypothetical protein